MIDDVQSRLTDCHSTVKHLQEENRQLRRACTAFGQLAERLNVELARVRAIVDRAVVESRDLHKSVENIPPTITMPRLEDSSEV